MTTRGRYRAGRVPRPARPFSERSTSSSGVGASSPEGLATRTPRPPGRRAMHVAFRPDHQGIPEATRVILDCNVPSLRERSYNAVVCDDQGHH